MDQSLEEEDPEEQEEFQEKEDFQEQQREFQEKEEFQEQQEEFQEKEQQKKIIIKEEFQKEEQKNTLKKILKEIKEQKEILKEEPKKKKIIYHIYKDLFQVLASEYLIYLNFHYQYLIQTILILEIDIYYKYYTKYIRIKLKI